MTPHEEMNDRALEREIEQLVSVEPSAQFQARVRARISADAIASANLGWWRWTQLGALGALVGLALLINGWHRTETSSEPSPVANSTAVAQSTGQAPEQTSESRLVVTTTPPASRDGAGRALRPLVTTAEARASSRMPFREVLVSAADAEGFQVLIAAVRSGRFDAIERTGETPSTVTAEGDESAVVPVPDPIVIAPLEITPLLRATVGAEAEGEAE
jgi:hypothetical protein